MPHSHKWKSESRNYRTASSADDRNTAIDKENHKVQYVSLQSCKTLWHFSWNLHKLKGIHTGKIGGQYRLSEECESEILCIIDGLCEWKCPLTGYDPCLLGKNDLYCRGVVDARFASNFSGEDWLKGFINCHQLITRLTDNVKSARVEINADAINEYFDQLGIPMEGINLENCFNYDETNITDNPGAKKVIAHQVRKCIEQKAEHSKQSTNVMFCGNALGQYLPSMVVYKAQNIYSN